VETAEEEDGLDAGRRDLNRVKTSSETGEDAASGVEETERWDCGKVVEPSAASAGVAL